MTKDLTTGNPAHLILSFAIPTFFGLLFQQLYSVVDSMIVGKLLGSAALAAVGSTGSINFLVIGFCVGMCSGFAIPVAQQMGAGNHSGLRRYVANAVWLSLIFSIIITVTTAVLCHTILTTMNTPADIYDQAYSYIFIIFLGIPACFLYNLLAGIIRSLGDSKTPVYFLALASVVNIVLDIVFIAYFHTGVAGAALATVLSQTISGIACIFYMKKKFPILHMEPQERVFHGPTAIALCNIGIPMGLQFSITAIGSIVLQTAVNGLGSVVVAGLTAGQKVSMFFCCPFDALGGTAATFCGQNVGAGKLDRLRSGINAAIFYGAVYSVIAFVLVWFFAPQLTMLFLNPGEENVAEILALSTRYQLYGAAFFIPLASLCVLRFAIQGMGFGTFAIIAGVMEMFARMIVGDIFVPRYGFVAACVANPAAWVAANVFLIPASILCISRLRKKQALYNQKLQ